MKRGIVAAVAAMCLLGAMSGCSLLDGGAAVRDADGQIIEAGTVDIFSVRVGDCFISTEMEDEISEVPAVPCGEAHDAEFIYIFDMPDGEFDAAAIEAAGQDACGTGADDYVGPNWVTAMDNDLNVSFFSPTAETWADGDREISCMIFTMSGDLSLTSSAEGLAP